MRVKRILSALLVVVLLISMPYASTKAAPTIPAQQARDLNILIDNEQWKPADANGKPLVPILINGSLYLPFRAVLERFGIGIDYNAVKRLLSLTSAPGASAGKATPKLMEVVPANADKPSPEVVFDSAAIAAVNLKGTVQQTTFSLSEDTQYFIYDGTGGSAGKATFKDFSIAKMTDVSRLRLVQDPETGVVKEVHYVREHGSGMATGKRISIEVEVSAPPLKIVITIRF